MTSNARPAIKRGTTGNLEQAGLKALPVGIHADGSGLYFRVVNATSRRWIYAWKRNGIRREFGLGTYPAVPLSRARQQALECRMLIAAGGDPFRKREEERASAAAKTFGMVMDDFLATKVVGLRNAKHRQQWRNTLETYAASLLRMPVAEVGTIHVLAVLRPIWIEKPETASRLRGRIENILDAAKTLGLRAGENPAAWRGHLKNILPTRNKKLEVKHFPARAWQDMPEFMAALEQSESMSGLCLTFIILTACRSSEGRGARWHEIDLEAGVWSIPAERTKTAAVHRVPLSAPALRLLRRMRPLCTHEQGLVFPGQKPGRPLTDVAVSKALKRIDPAVTVHGMRSTFRDWVLDATHFPRELAEMSLSHVVGDATERAYRRSDALDKRRDLMIAWASHLYPPETGKVVSLHGGARG